MCDLDYDPFLFMKRTGKKYGFNALTLETMTMQTGFWNFEPVRKGQTPKDYYSFPWFVDDDNIYL
jgi:hypothetical protein